MKLARLAAASLCVGLALAAFAGRLSAQDVFSSSGSAYPPKSYWDRITKDHPSCAGLVATHYEMTLELQRLDKEAKATVWPAQQEVVRRLNDLARQRNAVFRQITACVRTSLQAQAARKRGERSPASSDNRAPTLQGGVEQTDVDGGTKKDDETTPVETPPGSGSPTDDPPLRPGDGTPGVPTLPGGTSTRRPTRLPGGTSSDSGGPGTPPGNPPSSNSDDRRNPTDRSPTPRQPRVVFNYYYINGINTPLHGTGRGNTDWDRRLIAANLLDKGPRVGQAPQRGTSYDMPIRVGNEVDVLAPTTHNPSGKDPALWSWLSGFCSWADGATRGVAAQLASDLCYTARWLDAVRAGGLAGQAAGDVLESARQALETFPGATGIGFAAETDVVKQVTRLVLDTYAAEQEREERNYFIVIAHSQGNFFGEGVGFRLMRNLDRAQGSAARTIFETRLGIISIASPTSYDALPQLFRDRKVKHFTRADDGIVALRAFGGNAKRPWPQAHDLPPLWPWSANKLQAALAFGSANNPAGFPKAMTLLPPEACRCPEPDGALYIPLMNSHLLENYLADPALTEPGRAMNPQAAQLVGFDKPVTPATRPVLSRVRLGLLELKKELLAP